MPTDSKNTQNAQPKKKKKVTAKQRAKYNATRRDRYANDPEYRKREEASRKAYLEKHPEYGEEYNSRRRDRYANDEEYREQQKEKARQYGKNMSDEVRLRKNANARKNAERRAHETDIQNTLTTDFTPDTDITKTNVPSEIDMDTLESNNNPMSMFNDEHMQYQLKRAMNQVLSDRENYILTQSFGLFGQDQKDLEVIAKELGMTRERARMLREKAIMKLRDSNHLINLGESKQYSNTMKNRQIIRLTESDLHKLIKESVNNILKEVTLSKYDDNYSPYDEEMPEWYEENQEAIEAELDRLDGEADERGISHNDPRYKSQYRKIMRKYMH